MQMEENSKRVPIKYIILFSAFASVTAILPMVIGGVISVVIWAGPILFINEAWRSGRFFLLFPVGVFFVWMAAILIGAFVTGTAWYISPLKNI